MKADTIITDASILDPGPGRWIEALAVAGGRILYAGTTADVLQLTGPETSVYSLPGRTLLPGFCDSHLHFVGIGLALMGVDLQVESGVTELAALIAALRERAQITPAGTWVLGRGFDDLRLRERRNPNAADLDQVSEVHPVLIRRSCGHLAVVNTAAMSMLGITANTADPPGGKIERDSSGYPTGVLREAATNLVSRDLLYSRSDYLQAAVTAARSLLEHGITSAHTMDSDWLEVAPEFQQLKDCPRLYLTTPADSLEALTGAAAYKLGFASGFGAPGLRLGPVKVMLDGSDDSGTALMHAPYPNRPELGTGIAVMDAADASEVVTTAHGRGLQVCIHAIGDRAVDLAVDMIGKAMDACERPDPRHRIEHCSFTTSGALRAIASRGVVAAVQPPFIPMMDAAYRTLLGETMMERGYLFSTLLDLARAVPAGSDAPVANMCVLRGIRAAVDRLQGDGEVSRPDQRVSLLDALRMYTSHGALASFDEAHTGGLRPGMAADLVVLDSELDLDSGVLSPDVAVAATMLGGSWVYRDPDRFGD